MLKPTLPVPTPAQVKKNHSQYNFGDFLKALRKAHGLSRTQVGDKIGRTQQSLYLTEKNHNIPRIETIINLATIYRVNPSILLNKLAKML